MHYHWYSNTPFYDNIYITCLIVTVEITKITAVNHYCLHAVQLTQAKHNNTFKANVTVHLKNTESLQPFMINNCEVRQQGKSYGVLPWLNEWGIGEFMNLWLVGNPSTHWQVAHKWSNVAIRLRWPKLVGLTVNVTVQVHVTQQHIRHLVERCCST